MKKIRFVIVTIIVLVSMALGVSPPPIDSLFMNPRFSHPSLSLDGNYFAALYSEDDQQSLLSYDLVNKKAGRTSAPEGRDIYDYHWVSNESIIYEMSYLKQWAEVVGVINRDLEDPPKTLVEQRPVTVVDGLVHDKDHALLWFRNNPDDNTESEELVMVNVPSGKYGKREKGFPGRVLAWHTDMYGIPRLARAYRKGQEGKEDYYCRPAKDSSWRKVDFQFPEGFGIYGFTLDGSHLYMSAYIGKNTSSLCLFDLQKGVAGSEIYNDPFNDFDGRLFFFANPYFTDHVNLKGISYQDTVVWFDTSVERIQREIDSKLVATKNRIIDADTKLTKFLIESYSDIQPPRYLLYDTRTSELFIIAESMPWIRPETLCPMDRMSFLTHDSLRLSGYLTTPKNAKPPYPTIVLLHGGPYARDSWGFDPEVQLFATRGYAVLQVNYRGSIGFGKKISYENKFHFLKMNEDVKEATIKAIHSGLVDSNRIAIMGASFGGYLAIMGASSDNGLYSCAITNAGVFDWEMLWQHEKNYWNRRFYDEFQEFMALQPDQKKFLKMISPIYNTSRITIPVFIAGGKDDERVPIAQSYKLERLMKKAKNKPITFYKFGETHGFHYEKNRIKYYEKVLAFLNENIDKTNRKKK
jgi:dipeptidyl aminopeptidase/acylaminoacyl peptidase